MVDCKGTMKEVDSRKTEKRVGSCSVREGS